MGTPAESAGFRGCRTVGMNAAGIPLDGSDNCRIPAGMNSIMTGTPQKWSANLYDILERPFYLCVCDACLQF